MSISRLRAPAFLSAVVFIMIAQPAAARLNTTITATGAFGTLPVVAFDGTEAMSSLFRYEVDVVTDAAHPIAFDAVLGSEVTVNVTHGPTTRQFSGMCARISETSAGDAFTYRLELVPKLALLAMTEDSRIFQDQSVPDILQRVLASRGIDFQLALTRSHEPRNYCVQYRESDLNFISRLMEEEGIFYYFTHSANGHHMIVSDSSASSPAVQAPANFLPAVQRPDAEGLFAWQKTQELRPAKVTLFDFNFQLPDNHLDATSSIQPSVAVGSVTHRLALPATGGLEVYDYPGGYAKRFDSETDLQKIFTENGRAAAMRMQELASSAIGIDGGGNLPQFTAGASFVLAQHPNGNGQYVLTSVHHSTTQQGSKLDYQNTFTCIPLALPYRPPRLTPRPRIDGTQTAVVVGPAGEEIFTDKYGRVKVQFHWDRNGKKDANSSCWIRVSAQFAGQEFGFVSVPRIGQEVVVNFLEGDPDQPIIVGSAYNPDHLPPRCSVCP
jgi:type VI secretion system secreted protein VgrG